jgi:hypothetical protein
LQNTSENCSFTSPRRFGRASFDIEVMATERML